MLKVAVSYGELLDKYIILKVKKKNILDEEKIAKIVIEILQVEKTVKSFLDDFVQSKLDELEKVNSNLWGYEDRIRKAIRDNDEPEIIKCSHLICRTNDLRFEIKKQVNVYLNSDIHEVKEHIKY